MFNEEIAMSNTTPGPALNDPLPWTVEHGPTYCVICTNDAAHSGIIYGTNFLRDTANFIVSACNAHADLLHLAQYIADNADEVSPRVWSMAAKILEDVR